MAGHACTAAPAQPCKLPFVRQKPCPQNTSSVRQEEVPLPCRGLPASPGLPELIPGILWQRSNQKPAERVHLSLPLSAGKDMALQSGRWSLPTPGPPSPGPCAPYIKKAAQSQWGQPREQRGAPSSEFMQGLPRERCILPATRRHTAPGAPSLPKPQVLEEKGSDPKACPSPGARKRRLSQC